MGSFGAVDGQPRSQGLSQGKGPGNEVGRRMDIASINKCISRQSVVQEYFIR